MAATTREGVAQLVDLASSVCSRPPLGAWPSFLVYNRSLTELEDKSSSSGGVRTHSRSEGSLVNSRNAPETPTLMRLCRGRAFP